MHIDKYDWAYNLSVVPSSKIMFKIWKIKIHAIYLSTTLKYNLVSNAVLPGKEHFYEFLNLWN